MQGEPEPSLPTTLRFGFSVGASRVCTVNVTAPVLVSTTAATTLAPDRFELLSPHCVSHVETSFPVYVAPESSRCDTVSIH